jgi:hypothetical protein
MKEGKTNPSHIFNKPVAVVVVSSATVEQSQGVHSSLVVVSAG